MHFIAHFRNVVILTTLAALTLVIGTNMPCVAQSIYTVTLGTPGMNGVAGKLAFDLTQGDSANANNTVTVSAFVSDSALFNGGNINTAGASGNLPGALTLTDTQFFNESARSLVLENITIFTLDLSSNFAAPGSPDKFSFFLPDASGTGSVVTTSDPSGSNALFTIDIDGTPSGTLTTYAINTPGVSLSVVLQPAPPTVPEPGSLALLAGVGLSGAVVLTRHRKNVHQVA